MQGLPSGAHERLGGNHLARVSTSRGTRVRTLASHQRDLLGGSLSRLSGKHLQELGPMHGKPSTGQQKHTNPSLAVRLLVSCDSSSKETPLVG